MAVLTSGRGDDSDEGFPYRRVSRSTTLTAPTKGLSDLKRLEKEGNDFGDDGC